MAAIEVWIQMFKAINDLNNAEIISIDPAWEDRIEELRKLDRQDHLVCQGCRQAVRLRAGKINQRHFAHKTRKDCPAGKDSPLLLILRAALYNRLVKEFGASVTLEKIVPGVGLPRAMDCWVEHDGVCFAYWIIESQLRPDTRMSIQSGLEMTGARCHWVFADQMRRPGPDEATSLLLTPTERDFMLETKFDKQIVHQLFVRGKTLHYLNSEENIFTTYRSLSLIHEPQVFSGRAYTSSFHQALISHRTGEFGHPGESERLQELQQDKFRLEQLRAEQERVARELHERQQQEIFKAHRARAATLEAQREIALRREAARNIEAPTTSSTDRPSHKPFVPSPFSEPQAYECMICGQTTTSWWMYDGKINKCRCHECQRTGRTIR